ncbi:VOC family protein [Acidisoma silvae]|uniref:VOC family protein n=1 Tax=Acidisoma silvae TaxID=2802396 RepID=A0A963YVK4_9PROT|nr:VOC family protein [Acidisoma silvae]MCB8877896.1 VOC family protein [Acidisoma silvae]
MMPRLGYVVVYVPDVRKTIEFYVGAFGLEQRFISDDEAYGELETGATALGFVGEALISSGNKVFRPNRDDENPIGAKVAFVVEDVEAAYRKAIDGGASGYEEPEQKPWGQTVAYVRDLNGFIVELCNEFNFLNS